MLRQRGPVHDAPGALRRARKVPEEPRGLPGAEALAVPAVLLRLQSGAAPGAQPGIRPGADAAVLRKSFRQYQSSHPRQKVRACTDTSTYVELFRQKKI